MYQAKVVTMHVAEMVTNFVCGEHHVTEIGTECGQFPTWDDFVSLDSTNKLSTHYQVKSGSTNFSTSKVDNLTPTSIDKCFIEIARWVKSQDFSSGQRKFVLIVEDSAPMLREGLTLKELQEFHNKEIQMCTDSTSIKILQGKEKFKTIFAYLKNICEFDSDQSIIDGLKHLEILVKNTAKEIEVDTNKTLKRISTNPDSTRILIENLITNITSSANSIKPRLLLQLIEQHLHSQIPKWTLYKIHRDTCSKSGIHDIGGESVECPTQFVPALWKRSSKGRLILDFPAFEEPIRLLASLMRLSIHFQDGTAAEMEKAQRIAILTFIGQKLGKTIGKKSEGDFCDNINIQETGNASFPIASNILEGFDKVEKEADEIDLEMNRTLCSQVCKAVSDKISNDYRPSITTDITTKTGYEKLMSRWGKWEKIIHDDSKRATMQFEYMLSPQSEKLEGWASLRVGPKTVDLLANGLLMLLIVSISCDGSDSDWNIVAGNRSMNVISNEEWSGTNFNYRKPRSITDSNSIDELLEGNKPDILLFSATEESPELIFEKSLAGSNAEKMLFASKHGSIVIITNNSKFKKRARNGSFDEIYNQILDAMNFSKRLIEDEIKYISHAAPTNN